MVLPPLEHYQLRKNVIFQERTLFFIFFDGIHLITTVGRNTQESYITQNDRIILRKRAIIETVIPQLFIES